MTPEGSPSLTMTLEEAQSRLDERIVIGKKIDAVPVVSQQEYDEQFGARKTWDEFNIALLMKLFTDQSISKEYRNVGMYALAGDATLVERISAPLRPPR